MLGDLDHLQELAISKGGQTITLCTRATGVIDPLFKTARLT